MLADLIPNGREEAEFTVQQICELRIRYNANTSRTSGGFDGTAPSAQDTARGRSQLGRKRIKSTTGRMFHGGELGSPEG